MDVGEHDRQLRRVAALGNRAVVPPLRHPDRLGRRLHRQPPGSVQPVQRVRGHRRRGAVRVPRRDVPHAPDGGSTCAAVPRPSRDGLRSPAPCSPLRTSCWTVAVAMDRNDKDLFPPALPAALGIAALAPRGRVRLRGEHWPRVRDDRARNDLARGDAVRVAVPARDGVEHRLREQPHRRQRGVVPLRPPGHERRGTDLRARSSSCTRAGRYYVFRHRVGGEPRGYRRDPAAFRPCPARNATQGPHERARGEGRLGGGRQAAGRRDRADRRRDAADPGRRRRREREGPGLRGRR